MIIADVRFRSVVLTLILVVVVAGIIRLWPEQTTASLDRAPAETSAEYDPVKRHFDTAVILLRTGRFQQAINGFQAVLKQSPSMPEAYINTGFAQLGLELYEQARQSFQTAIDLRPAQVNAYWGLAVSLEGLCDIPGAIGAMRTYVHLAEPDDPFLVKASAALWEWEQLKTTRSENDQSIHACDRRLTQERKP